MKWGERTLPQMMANTTTANSLGAGAIDSSQHKELDQGIYCVLKETRARLFLGTQRAAQNRQLLRRHGVSRIVCVGTPAFHRDKVGGEEPLEGRDNDGEEGDSCNTIGNNNGSGFTYLEVPVLDLPSENLLVRLDECTSFIEGGMRRGQGVFVNCVFAQSRSVAGATRVDTYYYRHPLLSSHHTPLPSTLRLSFYYKPRGRATGSQYLDSSNAVRFGISYLRGDIIAPLIYH